MKIDGTDLEVWAQRLDSRALLPELVRRLIHGTIPLSNLRHIDFPSGEGVQKPGVDGRLTVTENHAFVPSGASVWEIGTSRDPKDKANTDYEKRSKNPSPGIDPAQTTFVFVTPRRWYNHEEWATEKRKEGLWANVRVLDADALENWLDQAPAARAWLGPRLGKAADAQELEDWWEEWSLQTDPPTSLELVRGGRDEDVEALYAWLASEPSVLSAEVGDVSEAAAFLYAAIRLRVRDEAVAILDRTVVAPHADAVRQLSLSGKGLIIAASECPIEVARVASQRGHHVLRATLSPSRGPHIALMNMPIGLMAAALERMGVESEEALDYARESAGSLTRVRHRLGEPPRFESKLSPWLLIPKLVESNEHDLETVAKVLDRTVAEVREDLRRCSTGPNAVFVREGHILRWASYELAWLGLATHLLKSDLDRFGKVVVEVFENTAAERYSTVLREGLVEVLAWAGTYSGAFSTGIDVQQVVRKVVSQLLAKLDNIDAWARLAPALPWLAEASPEDWLYAVSKRVEGSPELVRKILSSAPRFPIETHPHFELLRALEVLAWSREHLSEAALILAKLVELDPGGKWHPRPFQSLRHVFAPGYPQTCATLDEREAALTRIARTCPGVALGLILGFGSSTSVLSTHRPTVRDWADTWSEGLNYAELNETLERYQTIAMEIAVREPSHWGRVIRAANWFSEAHQARILQELGTSDFGSWDEETKESVRDAIRVVLAEAQQTEVKPTFPRPDQADILSRLLEKLAPSDVREQHRWLFAGFVHLPDVSIDDHKTHNETLIERRIAAAAELISALSNDEMLAFVETVGGPGPLGFALVESPADRRRVFELIELTFASSEDSQTMFRKGMLWALHKTDPEGLLQSIRIPTPDGFGVLTEVQRADLLAPLLASREVWQIVDGLGEQARLAYWRRMEPLPSPPEDTTRVIAHLIEAGRPIKALDVANHHMNKAAPYPPELIVSLLTAVATSESPEPDVMFGLRWVYVMPLLEQLKAAGDMWHKQVYALERLVLPKVSIDYRAKFLIEELERNPEAFVDLVRLLYVRDDGVREVVSEADSVRASQAWKILSQWNSLPGQSESGFTVDETALSSWVQRARDGLRARQRRSTGEAALGEVLAHAPIGTDGHWPHEAVRNLLERLNDTGRIEEGLVRGRRSARGWVTRQPGDGGNQERTLAERYEAAAAELRRRWPTTARCLETLAKRYRAEAAYNDRDAMASQWTQWLIVNTADRVRVFMDELQTRGQYTFGLAELANGIGVRPHEALDGATTLAGDRRLVPPQPDFFVIVPPQYRPVEAPPPSWYLDHWMTFAGMPYVVGLLSAAAHHGASEQAVQVFHVLVAGAMEPATVGRVRFEFVDDPKAGEDFGVVRVKTTTGSMRITTPERTLWDLIEHADAVGGIDLVARVIDELVQEKAEVGEALSGQAIAALSTHYPVEVAQRLGWVLEHLGHDELTNELRAGAGRAPTPISLRSALSIDPTSGESATEPWQVWADSPLETDS